jgi:hypothetical protein
MGRIFPFVIETGEEIFSSIGSCFAPFEKDRCIFGFSATPLTTLREIWT